MIIIALMVYSVCQTILVIQVCCAKPPILFLNTFYF